MSETVFILGAGFNQFLKKGFNIHRLEYATELGFSISDINTGIIYLSPPMANNFLKYALIRHFSAGYIQYGGINNNILNYIEKNFNRSRQSLLNKDFDIELLFTFIESQINDAVINKNEKEKNKLEEIRQNLMISIGDIFFELEWQSPSKGHQLLEKFGKLIHRTHSDIITFNYDCLVERGLEKSAGKIHDKNYKEGNPRFNWDRFSAYDIKFTKIRMNTDNYWDGERGRNVAKKFYKYYNNPSQPSKIIKLHGSYNWYKYCDLEELPRFKQDYSKPDNLYIQHKTIPPSLEKELLCFNGDWQFGQFPKWSPSDKHVLESLLIPPILLKEQQLRTTIFNSLWQSAKKLLLNCRKVIFIGYSFPDTDFYSKKLFIEVFSEKKDIEVTMVNPDSSIQDKFRNLVNYKKEILSYNNIQSFIKSKT